MGGQKMAQGTAGEDCLVVWLPHFLKFYLEKNNWRIYGGSIGTKNNTKRSEVGLSVVNQYGFIVRISR